MVERPLHAPTPSLPPELFIANRDRLAKLLPANSLAVLNANDIPPTNSDGSAAAVPNSDLFYLTGVAQEQSILLLYPEADDEKQRAFVDLLAAAIFHFALVVIHGGVASVVAAVWPR